MNIAPEKPRWLRDDALAVANEIIAALESATTRIVITGSLRREKSTVGDVEILYVPRLEERQMGLFDTELANLAEEKIARLLKSGKLAKRSAQNGRLTWGIKNKLAMDVRSGIPVDLFATTDLCWWNALVCRTGPSELNRRIANAAIERGWHWFIYGTGFSREKDGQHEEHMAQSEEDVFHFVGLPFVAPGKRDELLRKEAQL